VYVNAAVSSSKAVSAASLSPTVVTFNTAISACEISRHWHLASTLLDGLRCQGLEPDNISYGTAMSAHAKAQRWRSASALFEDMQR